MITNNIPTNRISILFLIAFIIKLNNVQRLLIIYQNRLIIRTFERIKIN